MAKKVEGALYKMKADMLSFKKGSVVKLIHDDGSKIPKFSNHDADWYVQMNIVKLLKPKKGDTVRLVSKKHTTKALSWAKEDMEKKGAEFTLLNDIDLNDDTFEHNGYWYHKKDLVVIKRPGVDF